MNRIAFLCFASLVLMSSASVSAQKANRYVELGVTPTDDDNSWVVELTAKQDVEVSFDRYELELYWRAPTAKRRRGKKMKCNYVGKPGKGRDAKVSLSAGERVREQIDLRMFCRRADRLDSLLAQPELSVSLKRRGKVGKRRRLLRAETTFSRNVPVIAEGASTATLVAKHAVMKSGRLPTVQVALRSPERKKVYILNDRYSFSLKIDEQTTESCGVSPVVVVPVIEFFQTVGPKRGPRKNLSLSAYCGELKLEPGVYRVTPALDLPFDGDRFGLTTLTGKIEGAPFYLRVLPRKYESKRLN